MRTARFAKAAGVAFALAASVGLTGCDTNYYGDSGRQTTTTTTTVPPPPSATTTTTVTPNPDGSVTSTERTYRRY